MKRLKESALKDCSRGVRGVRVPDLPGCYGAGDSAEAAIRDAASAAREEGRTVRANLTFDAGLLGAIDAAASERGLTRSAFLASAAREKIAARR